jgi:hypothetical protein
MRAAETSVNSLLTTDKRDFPLYFHAIPFIAHTNSIVVSAASLVLLICCLFKAPEIQKFLSEVLNIAHLEVTFFGCRRLTETLTNCDIVSFCRAATSLTVAYAKHIFMQAVSQRIDTLSMRDPLSLGRLLHCIETRLILMDTAVRYGLIPPIPLHHYSHQEPLVPSRNLVEEISAALRGRVSVRFVIQALRVLEKLYDSVPAAIFRARADLIDSLRKLRPNEIMEAVLEPPGPQIRLDLNFLLTENERGVEFLTADDASLFQAKFEAV